MSDPEVARFASGDVREQILAVLTAWGMPSETAGVTADVMIDTDLSGVDSHGVSMLMMYEKLREGGRLNLQARPTVIRETAAFATVDAQNGLGHPAAVAAVEVAIAKARQSGIGAVSVAGSNHYGAVGHYVRRIAQQGMLGLATTTTRTPVAHATGGRAPILGTNPIAFAAPRTHGEPLVVDMSTTVVALNKVKVYWLKGLDLPVGWVIDRDGNPITDAEKGYRLLQEGAATLSPLGGVGTELGGHKGFGLSLLVHVLSGSLVGAAIPGVREDTDNLGHFFLAIDAEQVNPGGLTEAAVEQILRAVQEGEPDVLLPGQPEEKARAERSLRGIPLPRSLVDLVHQLSTRAGVTRTLTPLTSGEDR